ncbi:MAG: CDP-alcohol phosphatidyltransferase family protein [Planctomycetota bacterium]|nr:CDP-alcohol phosphatidyltransferase family protein [Planctomycetota bacterium]MEC9157554.1 CDP-alcohol phosphatidyltransferase family protein [Planctomycetota bacterium]
MSTSPTPTPTPQRIERGTTRGRRPRRVPPISTVPTLMTLGNLLCGFAAIHYATQAVGVTSVFGWSSLTVAGLLIFVGMFFDSIDGTIARLTKSTSELGAVLDSLADVVTFGVAPALMMLRLITYYYYGPEVGESMVVGNEQGDVFSKLVWGIAAVYVCCATLRLARFQVETPSAKVEDHRYFSGLPTPGAAGAVASLIVLHQHLLFKGQALNADAVTLPSIFALGVPVVTLLCAIGMVSRIRYDHFANRYLRPKRDFTQFARIMIPLVFLILWPQITFAAGFTTYAVSGPVAELVRRSNRRGKHGTRPA